MALKPMGPIERAINTLIDFEKEIKLLKQDLYAELPKRRVRQGAYFIDHEGKRQYYLRKPKNYLRKPKNYLRKPKKEANEKA